MANGLLLLSVFGVFGVWIGVFLMHNYEFKIQLQHIISLLLNYYSVLLCKNSPISQ